MVRRSTWILLGFLAAAILVVAGWQRLAPASSAATPTSSVERLWNLTAEQVSSLRLVRTSDQRLVVVVRDPDQGWRMQAPAMGEADAGRIEAAVAGLLAPAVQQALTEATNLEPFGLAPSPYRLTLLLADGTARSVDVGKVDPTGTIYYVQVPGDPRVLMVSRFSLEEMLGLVETPPYPEPTATPAGEALETQVP